MNTNELLLLGMLSFMSLCIPIAASGFLRMQKSEMGPVKLMGQFSCGAGVLGIVCGLLTFFNIYPQAFFLLLFATSFGLGAWMLGAFLDKSGYRVPDYVMLFWVAIAGTLILTRVFF
ncbi:MAG: hypothetical protein AAFQ36_07335 [Pseudomonadota bacterium]